MRLPKNDHLAALTIVLGAMSGLALFVFLIIITKGWFFVGLVGFLTLAMMYALVFEYVEDSRSGVKSGNPGPG